MSFLIPFNIDNIDLVEKDNLKKSLSSKNISNIAFDKINSKYQLVVTYADKTEKKVPLDNFMPENIVTKKEFEKLKQEVARNHKHTSLSKIFLVKLYRLVGKIVKLIKPLQDNLLTQGVSSASDKTEQQNLDSLIPKSADLLDNIEYYSNEKKITDKSTKEYLKDLPKFIEETVDKKNTTKYLTEHGDTALDTLYRKNLYSMKGGTRYTIPIFPMPQSNRQKLVTGIELVGKNLVVNYTDNSKTQIDLSNIVGSITAPPIDTAAIEANLLASLQTKFEQLSDNLVAKGSSELDNLKTNIAQIKTDIREQLKTELAGTTITQEQLTALDEKLQADFKKEIENIKVVKEVKLVK